MCCISPNNVCVCVYSLIAALHQSLQFKVNLIVHICMVLLTNMLFVIELLSISLTSVSGHLLIHCQSGSFPFALLFPTYFLPCSFMVGCLSAATESCIVSQQFSVLCHSSHTSRNFITILNRIISTLVMLFLSFTIFILVL